MPRALLPVLLVVILALAGCTSNAALTPASTNDIASMGDAMLAHPPGSDVKPTGKTDEVDLYLFQMATPHELYPGASMNMWGFSLTDDAKKAQFPGPTLRTTEGNRLVIHFHVGLSGYNHTLHFHGQNVPNAMDGVPFMTQKPVEPGQSCSPAVH